MKYFLSLIISGALVVSGFGQTRNVLVGTNNAVVQPTNFWSADAANARTGLGLGTAATNPATAFQPASTNLTLLASGDGSSLTNLNLSGLGAINITNISGLQSALDGKLATNGSALNLTNFPDTILQTTSAITNFPAGLLRVNGDGSGLTNLPVPAVASNVLSTILVSKGGTGATNASGARINLGSTTVGDAVFTATNADAARTALSLGTASTNASTDFQPSSSNLTNLATNNGGNLTNIAAANISGVVALDKGGTGGTNASSARSSLGATTVGANLFTLANPDDTRFIRLNANNTVSALSAADMRTALSIGTNLGTVTSVGLTVPSFLSVSTPTITSSGTFAITLGNQTSRNVFVAPNGGGIPAFRALESDDLPSLAISKITGLQTALDGKLSTTGTAPLATNVTGVVALANGGTGGTNAASARSGLGATTVGENIFTLLNPSAVRFLRLNADNTVSAISDSDFRTALSLGTAATNPASAFQPADSDLNALAANNGGSLTNLIAANIVGTVALASNITGTAPLATNITGTVAIANGGTGATNVAGARTALGASTIGGNLFTLVNPSAIRFLRLNADNTATALSDSDFRTAIGLGTAATNAESAFQPSSANLTTLAGNNASALTNLQATNLVGLIPASNIPSTTLTNITGTLAIASGGTGATNAATARTNLGLGWSALTNTDSTSFRNAIGLGTTNDVFFNSINLGQTASSTVYSLTFGQTNTGFRGIGGGSSDFGFYRDGSQIWQASGSGFGVSVTSIFSQPLRFSYGSGNLGYIDFVGIDPATGAAISRTNLGLPWSGLTNTNAATFQTALFGANTNPVLVDTNGSVVSPTNFWQAAPIATALQNSQPVANATNAATNARLLFLFSLAPSTTGVTNTITLPTNGNTFNGDVATITHAGPTSSVTAIRELGASTNLITLNQVDETVRFLYRNDQWELMDNISYIEPIYFSGTNAAANAAQSRTNLGLGWTALTNTNSATALLGYNETNDTVVSTQRITFNALGVATGTAEMPSLSYASGTNTFGTFAQTQLGVGPYLGFSVDGTRRFYIATNDIRFELPVSWDNTTNAAITRTNLGIPLAALTNTDVTNFRTAIGLGATNTVLFDEVSANKISSVSFEVQVGSNGIEFEEPTVAAITRTNLGIPLAALTNTSNTNFQAAVFNTNTAPTNTANVNGVGFNTAVGWMEVTVQTNGTNATFRIPLFQ